MDKPNQNNPVEKLLEQASALRWQIGNDYHDKLTEGIYSDAASITQRAEIRKDNHRSDHFDRMLDRILTSRKFGFPIMALILSVILWLTIQGANYPSGMLDSLLLGIIYPFLKNISSQIGLAWWIDGLLIDGIYMAVAWVVAVMLPPMAIFFPLFTLLEDFGYLPRVAFNLDGLFKRTGAHGKQALTMSMGWGCNAAGVVATRIIDSPRERLIAIITNNFSLCNGRWPTQILIATIFIGALVPAGWSGLVSTAAVIGIAFLGVFFTFFTSWLLSRTMLKGEVSTFTLELPPYRPPRFWKTLYTSLIDRTIIVLWRAVVFAAPAGAVIWLISNIDISGQSLAYYAINFFDDFGFIIGLNGVIILAYIVAIPANEIVIPTILMLTVAHFGMDAFSAGDGVMFELDSDSQTGDILRTGGWTLLTGINLMLFSLLHNPCSTTIFTIYKETKSWKWTTVATIMPIIFGIVVCFLVAQFYRILF
ncbi:nucleoside recognition domain-containing protein [Marinoscillum sp.]|uniref:nucleoside recognition domain-containing protein n=1 Tax=Marinoscillum sp. TaxID=2024838 RepID=UPI003BA8F6FC